MSFLDEIAAAREQIKTWPQWMQDAAVIATASLPVIARKENAE